MVENKEILDFYNELSGKLTPEEKELVHFKSVSNFIHHLINNPSTNTNENRKLQELGEVRMKKKIFDYLEKIKFEVPKNKEESIVLYSNYIEPIGKFMSQYYKFSGSGGKLKILDFIIVVIIGLILDTLIYFIFDLQSYLIFTPFLVITLLVRIIIKNVQKKVYGVMY